MVLFNDEGPQIGEDVESNQDGVYPLQIRDPKFKTKERMCQSQGTDDVIITVYSPESEFVFHNVIRPKFCDKRTHLQASQVHQCSSTLCKALAAC